MVGDRIKILRTDAGISQKEFSNLINVAPSTIGMYESNKRIPSSEMLDVIASHFDVSVDYLLGRTEMKKANSLGENKLTSQIETIAAHLEGKDITPHKMKMIKRYIDDLFDEEF